MNDLLNDKQQRAVALIAEGLSDAAVAMQCGTSRETVNRWRNSNAAVRAAVNSLHSEAAEMVKRRIIRLAGLSLETLENILNDTTAPPAVRCKIAMVMLDHFFDFRPGETDPLELQAYDNLVQSLSLSRDKSQNL